MGSSQMTLSPSGFERYRKGTRREQFLAEMERAVPWAKLYAVIEPHYPKVEGVGRPTVGLEKMLRMYLVAQWFDLTDPGAEEALYDSPALCAFVGVDLGREPVPDETTLCKFRHLLEDHGLARKLFAAVNHHLQFQGLKIGRGTIVDATIITAPSSTKNQSKSRDPEMCQTKKGNQWYFGMKAHIGVDSHTKLIHSVFATPANTHDSQALPYLLHGKETRVWGDSAYTGQTQAILKHAPHAQDFTHHKSYARHPLSEADRERNRTKSRVRARVEHLFRVIKRQFGFVKVRYRGLKKNAHRLLVTCALANLYIVRRQLLRRQFA
ncbi:MAG: IS5 family transposase [Gammaproteobacteria bacterium]